MEPVSPEQLRDEIEAIRRSVEEKREKLRQLREERAKAEAKARSREEVCFWMDNAIIPYLTGIADSFNEDLITGVRRLIKEGKNPIVTRRAEAELAIKSFFSTPQTRVLYGVARPYIQAKTEEILEGAEWIREEVLKEEYPLLYEAVAEEEGGKQWLDNLIKSFVQMVRRLR